jgi:hypothetical protein
VLSLVCAIHYDVTRNMDELHQNIVEERPEESGNHAGAFFKASIQEFLDKRPDEILSTLHRRIAAEVTQFQTAQHGAWAAQLPILFSALRTTMARSSQASKWGLFLEYSIPGRRKRLDCVILTERGIVPIEFKVGASAYSSEDRWQLLVYCWNLRDFHRESRGRFIAPILVATEAVASATPTDGLIAIDQRRVILKMQCLNSSGLSEGILAAHSAMPETASREVNIGEWNYSQTEPTENILEAAQRLFGSTMFERSIMRILITRTMPCGRS